MTDHREQNSSCPVTWDDEPRGFLTEWEATSMKPTEDAKMKNDEADRPMPEAFKDPHHLANTADAMGRLCKSWQGSTAEYHFACRDLIRAQAARIAELEPLATASIIEVAAWNPSVSEYMDHWEARAEAAEAEVARLREALTLIERLYYIEDKDAEWRASRMNGVAREAQDGNDLGHYRRIFPSAVPQRKSGE